MKPQIQYKQNIQKCKLIQYYHIFTTNQEYQIQQHQDCINKKFVSLYHRKSNNFNNNNIVLESKNMNHKVKYLELSSKLGQNRFFFQSDAPRAIDAKIFNIIKQRNQLPEKSQFPQLYHWYVFLKQFAPSALEKWTNTQQLSQQQNEFLTRVQELFQISINKAQKETNNAKDSPLFKGEQVSRIISGDSQKLFQYKMILNTVKTLTLRDFQQWLIQTKGKQTKIKSIRVNKTANGANEIYLSFISRITGRQLLKQALSNCNEVISYGNQLIQEVNNFE